MDDFEQVVSDFFLAYLLSNKQLLKVGNKGNAARSHVTCSHKSKYWFTQVKTQHLL